jgi:hypothetical protein
VVFLLFSSLFFSLSSQFISLHSSRYSESVMNSYPSMGSASSIAQFYHQAAAVSAAGGVGMDSLGSACSQLGSGALSSVGTGQALSEITRHPWLVPTGEFISSLLIANLVTSYFNQFNLFIMSSLFTSSTSRINIFVH